MKIETITLSNYRNYSNCRIKTNNLNNIVITGENGTGKTNILEAISLFSTGSGLRHATLNEIQKINEATPFGVNLELDDGTILSIGLNNNCDKKIIMIDKTNASLSEILKYLRLVWVSPREDRIFCDSVSDRRGFFDNLISSFEPDHSGRLSRLSKLLSERANALKMNANDIWLSEIENHLAPTAVAITYSRVSYASNLNHFLMEESGFGQNTITMIGGMETDINAGKSMSEIENLYRKYLSENRFLINEKQTINGPHKSDISVYSVKYDKPAYMCSTGQQKMILLSLILAHSKMIKIKTGQSPIILLDELVAHLDSKTRELLYSELGKLDTQIWMTGTDKTLFENLTDSLIVEL